MRSLLFFICLLFFNSVFANDLLRPNVIIQEKKISAWLQKMEGWDSKTISYDYEALSQKSNVLIRSYVADRYCGKGACTHYVFLKLKNNNWRLIAIVAARFTVDTQASNGFFDIVATHELPGITQKPMEQRYIYDGQVYRPQ